MNIYSVCIYMWVYTQFPVLAFLMLYTLPAMTSPPYLHFFQLQLHFFPFRPILTTSTWPLRLDLVIAWSSQSPHEPAGLSQWLPLVLPPLRHPEHPPVSSPTIPLSGRVRLVRDVVRTTAFMDCSWHAQVSGAELSYCVCLPWSTVVVVLLFVIG